MQALYEQVSSNEIIPLYSNATRNTELALPDSSSEGNEAELYQKSAFTSLFLIAYLKFAVKTHG